jgi:hypothetical protein
MAMNFRYLTWPYDVYYTELSFMCSQAFADELLALGEGRTERHRALGDDVIEVDPKYLIPAPGSGLPSEDVNDRIDWVFPDLAVNCTDPTWLFGRAILTPKNTTVDAINDMLTERFPGMFLPVGYCLQITPSYSNFGWQEIW